MRNTVSAKRCPHCGTVTALQARECPECGHRFRTRFAEPDDRTEAFDAVLLARPAPPPDQEPPKPRRRRARASLARVWLGVVGLASMVGLGVWLAGHFGPKSLPARRPASSSAGVLPSSRAEALYERLTPSMSLHDVDRAAGGLGRLSRPSNPHLLLLSYDYPAQSVRVSLYRRSLAGDFRVRSVALYHGNLLLRLRRAGH